MMLFGWYRGARKVGGGGMEKESPAISVIIPMYNVERYIVYCMESLMQQTFTDYEIILVDDASTDNTYRVCQRLFGQDKRVTLLRNTTNQGQCHSRNRGLECARGTYVYFMDSDDEILPWGLEKLHTKAEAEKADVVHSNFYASVYTHGRMRLRKSLWLATRGHDTGEGLLQGTLKERFEYQGGRSMPMPWMNLYRREFLLREKILFPDLTISEDDMFSMMVILKAGRFVRINDALYLYRQHFHEQERIAARLPRAFSLMEKALQVIEGIFAPYTEEEIPFSVRQDFKAGWVRAHLRAWVFNILDTKEKYGMEAIRSLLADIAPSHSLLVSVFIYMLENDTGMWEKFAKDREKKRQSYQEIFAEFEKGSTRMKGNFDWLYSQSRQAALIKGGEPDYYKATYKSWARAAFRLGRHQEALEAYQKAMECTESYSPELLEIFDGYLYAMHFQDFSVEDIAKVHRLYGQQLAGVVPYSHAGKGRIRDKIRIGYIASFCGQELLEACYGLLLIYDREAFEVYCYHTSKVQDGCTKAVKESVDRFAEMSGLRHEEIAEVIHDDGIDVLIDLMGHLPGGALPVLAYRPAPVQISGIGYPSTTGMEAVDYYLTDEIIDPPGESEGFFAEKLLYLPCRFSFGRREEIPLPKEPPCLRRGYVTFGVFAPYYQLDDSMLGLWREIMEAVPDSQLLVWADDFACEAMVAEAKDRFIDQGLDVRRVHFEAGTQWEGYRKVDIMLDTWPCSSGMKMIEALYMGIPAVTLYGERRDTRLGLSILHGLGLLRLAAESRAEYVQKAMYLAKQPEELKRLHQNLRSILKEAESLDSVHCVCELEAALKNII